MDWRPGTSGYGPSPTVLRSSTAAPHRKRTIGLQRFLTPSGRSAVVSCKGRRYSLPLPHACPLFVQEGNLRKISVLLSTFPTDGHRGQTFAQHRHNVLPSIGILFKKR